MKEELVSRELAFKLKEGWVNVYEYRRRDNGIKMYFTSSVYDTKEEAIKDKNLDDALMGKYITTTKISWEE